MFLNPMVRWAGTDFVPVSSALARNNRGFEPMRNRLTVNPL